MADRANGHRSAAGGRAANDRAVATLGDRITIVGRSGSGKSTLLRTLIRRYRRAVLIDPKVDDPIPDWHHSIGAAAFRADFPARHQRIVAQPGAFEDYLEWFDAVCRHAYRVGSVAVGIDDLPGELTVGGQRSRGLEELYRQGRSRRVMPIGCIQRAKTVPLVMFSEATQLYVFDLLLDEDRDRVRQVIGDFPRPRTEHGFVYARPGDGRAVECAPLSI